MSLDSVIILRINNFIGSKDLKWTHHGPWPILANNVHKQINYNNFMYCRSGRICFCYVQMIGIQIDTFNQYHRHMVARTRPGAIYGRFTSNFTGATFFGDDSGIIVCGYTVQCRRHNSKNPGKEPVCRPIFVLFRYRHTCTATARVVPYKLIRQLRQLASLDAYLSSASQFCSPYAHYLQVSLPQQKTTS